LDGEIVELEVWWSMVLWCYDAKQHSIQTFVDKHTDTSFFHYPINFGKIIPLTSDLTLYITAPILWFDLLLPLVNTQAWNKEKQLFDAHGLHDKKLRQYKIANVFGLRRRIRTRPKKAKYYFDGDDVVIQFTLDSGVYASILIDKLLKKLT
jgi:tRNA(Glu) U13 pseudouridine synthase TruD